MRTLVIALALALGVAGCAMTQPMMRLENQPVSANSGGAEGVGAAIERALVSRNWVVTARRPGDVDATLVGPDFRADITVPYSATSYSIRYRDSEGLDYSGSMIHRHYNNWVNNLRISIERELLAAPPLTAAAPQPQPQQDQPQGTGQ
jgi:hypothetical protein